MTTLAPILAILAIATLSALVPGFGAAIVMSVCAVCIASLARRWIVADSEVRAKKMAFDAAETRSLREHNVRKAEVPNG